MRILIVKLGSIGDVVHTLPALAAIKAALPGARVSWAVERRAAEVLRENPLIERLVEVDTKGLRRVSSLVAKQDGFFAQLNRLRASDYDVALDFQGLLKSAFVARLAGASRRVGFAREALREPASRFLYTETVATPARAHVIEKNLRLLAGALDIRVPSSGDDYDFPITVRSEHEAQAAQVLENFGISFDANTGFAILNPAGGWWTKLWDAERFARLADALWDAEGLRSVVTYGPGEEKLATRVVAHTRSGAAHAVSLPLKSFFALAKHARVYVGGDTGPTHLAIAARAPVVGLFGPTEWWRNGSPRAADIVVERLDINCRENCHRRACDAWVCMDIEVASVLAAVRERLARERRVRREQQGAQAIIADVFQREELSIGA